jgi:DNA repair exonuclease SbcCD ATPase subunit
MAKMRVDANASRRAAATAGAENTAPVPISDAQSVRLDPAHRVGSTPEIIALEAESALAADSLSLAADAAAERLRAQAEQLGSHLRAKQEELDRREAQTNARISLLENELRASRLWLSERVQHFNDLQQSLEAREQAAEFRAAANGEELETLRRRARELEGALEQSQTQLRQLTESRDQAQQECDHAQREIDAQRNLAREARQMLEQHAAELEAERERLVEERERLTCEAAEQLQLLADQRRIGDVESARRKAALDQRQQHLELRESALEQLQRELSEVQREILEMRLAVEETWAQLAQNASPAELTRSIARIRSRLAEHYQLQTDAMVQKKSELARLAERLESRQQDLSREREELLAWYTRREQETEQRAAHLVAREQELDLQDRAVAEEREQWARERRKLQAELRRLALRDEASELAAA